MADETNTAITCRLCGLVVRPADDAAKLAGEIFHVPCAEDAFKGEKAWKHVEIGTTNQLAQALGHAALGFH